MPDKMKTLYILILSLFFLTGCKENSNIQLPPATQTGKGILGCLVNGEVFIAQGGFIGGVDDLTISVAKDVFALGGTALGSDTEIDGNLYLQFYDNYNIYNQKTFPLINKTDRVGMFRNSADKTFTTGEDRYIGELIITKLDTANHIVSGTFWFDAVSEDGEVIEVREGRFDDHYACCTQYPEFQ